MENRTEKWLITVVVIVLAVLSLVFLTAILFPNVFPSWLGTSPIIDSKGETIYPGKSLWDLVELLIVPLVLAIIAFMFNSAQANREQESAEKRNQEEVLQSYIELAVRQI